MRQLSVFILTLTCSLALAAGADLGAQEPAQAGTRQETANQKFAELTESMERLQALLAKTNPDDPDGRLIGGGLLFVQERKIHDGMRMARMLLDGDKWDDAEAKMKVVRKDLKQLLDLLQNRNLDLAALLARIEQLEGFRGEVDRLVAEQQSEKQDSARVEALQQQLERIAQAKAKAEQILNDQKELRAQTNELGLNGAAQQLDPLEQREGELAEDANALAEDLDKIEQKAADLAEEAKDASKPGEGKPGEGKPGESKPGEGKPGESKPGEGKPGESKPGEGKPSQGASSSSAKSAAKSMSKAQEQLGNKQPESSLKDQDQAIEQLEQTVKELEQLEADAQRELLKLPFDMLAKKQSDTQKATDTLAQEMEQAEEGSENGEGQPTPGRKSVQQAVPKQKAAAGQLKEYKPAKQKQQDAKEDLESARDELEEALAQLRQQLQDEVLRALEERFTAMLAKQRELSLQTKTLDKTREQVLTADGALPSALQERIQTVAAGEQDLEVEAGDALKLLEEEGTTAVFPEIVRELKHQLQDVARGCRSNATGNVIQKKQAEVEDTLSLLINALRKTIERRDGG